MWACAAHLRAVVDSAPAESWLVKLRDAPDAFSPRQKQLFLPGFADDSATMQAAMLVGQNVTWCDQLLSYRRTRSRARNIP